MPTLSLIHRQLITADEGSSVLHCALSLTLLHRPLTGSYLQLDQIFHHESDTTVDVCVLVHAERDAVCSNSHTRQTPFETMQVFPNRHLSCLVCACWVVCSLCVSMFGSRFGRNPVSCLQISVFVLSAHNFRYWMDFTCYWAVWFSKVYFCYQHGPTVTGVWYLEATWKHFYFWLASKEPGFETGFFSLVLLP